MFGKEKVYPGCRNASNPCHECSEYCFKVIAKTKARTNQSQSGTEMGLGFKACVECTEKCFLVHGNKRDASPVITSFVTVMSGNDFSKSMELPPCVALVVSLADQFTFIEDSQGPRWNVAISSMDGSFAFQHGWNAFSLDHDLQLGNILVFTYIKGSHFAVKIYDNSGCELIFFETDQKKRKRDDKDPIFKGGWCYATDKSAMNKDGSGTCGCSDAEISKQSNETNGKGKAPTVPVILEENEEIISTTSARETKKCRTGDGSGVDEGISRDQRFKPDHPTFAVMLQDPSYLTSALKINLTFAQKYNIERGSVNLQIPNGSTWLIICSVTDKEQENIRYNRDGVARNRYPSYCIKSVLLSADREEVARIRYQGWIKFATDNGLQVGDTCVLR